MRNERWSFGLGLCFVFLSLVALFLWIPADTETGLVEKERRKYVIGDALAPTALMVLIFLVSLALTISSFFNLRRRSAPPANPAYLSGANFRYSLSMLAIVALSLLLMAWSGAVFTQLLNTIGFDIGNYRALYDTVPYKYIGFALGGFVMVFGLVSMIEGRFSLIGAWVAIGMVLLLIAVYDLPFDDLLLPPNGDQ